MCDFVIIVKLCCSKLYKLNFDPKTKYCQKHFKAFLDSYDCNNNQLLTTWWIDLTTNIQYVIFYFQGKWYQLYKTCLYIGVFTQATKDDWTNVFEYIKV